MKDIITAAVFTPKLTLGDPLANAREIIEQIKKAAAANVSLAVFPELCLTGYSAGDLFFSDTLLSCAREALAYILEESSQSHMLIFVGLPLLQKGKLYNVAAAIEGGKLLAFIPKTHLPSYGEFHETRFFASGTKSGEADFMGQKFPFGTNIVFTEKSNEHFRVCCEICEDIWAVPSPGERHARAGANVIVNLSASNEFFGKREKRKSLIKAFSLRAMCAYLYANAGTGESSGDVIFTGNNLIYENGALLKESDLKEGMLACDLDLGALDFERRKDNTFISSCEDYLYIPFTASESEGSILRRVSPAPFVEEAKDECERIFRLQTEGLKRRLIAANAECAVIGVSGGLDSTLALLVAERAARETGIKKGVVALTMPGPGTGERTFANARALCESLNVKLNVVCIEKALERHLQDIGHDKRADAAYENAQARERTQILMDVANMENGLVVGTGDMSELALGWATYNGDQMSMYGVNASIPKTLLKEIVRKIAAGAGDALKKTLLDILDTEISPELLPAKKGEIAQKTESLVGPYALHDFFLYYILAKGFTPAKLFLYAQKAFDGVYGPKEICKWMRVFYSRFFSQQFKRSPMPDGAKVAPFSLSPRGDLIMPSDMKADIWLREIDALIS